MSVRKRYTNHLDKLSPELYSLILNYADTLTRFLNNHIPEHMVGEPDVMVEIWCQAFKMDWQGDLRLLPFGGFPDVRNGLCLVQSKSMYRRVCELRPDLNRNDILRAYFINDSRRGWVVFGSDSINGAFSNEFDDDYSKTDLEGIDMLGDRLGYSVPLISTLYKHLINVPLRNGWLEELDPVIVNAPPILLAHFALVHGHLKLYQELVHQNEGRPLRRQEEERIYLFDAAARQSDEKLFEDLIAAGYTPPRLPVQARGGSRHRVRLQHVLSPGHRGYFRHLCEHEDPDRLLEKMDGCMTSDVKQEPLLRTNHLLPNEVLDKMLTIAGATGNDRIYQYLHQKIKGSKGREWIQDMVECIRNRESWPRSQITYQSIAFLHKHSTTHCDPVWMTEFVITNPTLAGVLAAFHRHCQCPEMFTPTTMNLAAKYGCLNHVKFLDENRNEGCSTEAMDVAARNGHLEAVQYLHENRNEGCTTNAMDGAAGRGLYDMVKWLHENRNEGCTTKAIDDAARIGCLDVVRFLQRNRHERCSLEGLKRALVWRQTGSILGTIKFLLDHYGERFDLEKEVFQNMDGLDDRVRTFLIQWKSEQAAL
ncbi:hypothetical protein HDU76_001957 [Blyttiomyces sp. JEL0837]|nr:hypothetical protein HDU76_001957 [Blyttiomyces sp. JEL0837]